MEYITVAEVFIDYPLKHCTVCVGFSGSRWSRSVLAYLTSAQAKEVNILVTDIVKHVEVNHAYEDVQLQLQSIVTKILYHFRELAPVLAMVCMQHCGVC